MSKETSPAEEAELFALLKDNPSQQYLFDLLNGFWAGNPVADPNDNSDAHFNHILERAAEEVRSESPVIATPTPQLQYRKIYPWVAAASVILVAALGYFYLSSPKTSAGAAITGTEHKNEIKARMGSRSRLELPDGTKVWLNADSRIIYGQGFNKQSREVEIEGEAFFDVTKNAKLPFIVHAGGIDVRVLGTAFNVKSYPDDPTIETTLMRGAVEVIKTNEPSGARILLQPHEKLVFTKSIDSLRLLPSPQNPPQEMLVTSIAANIPDSSMKETSWVYDRLFFDGDTFTELAGKMERWFNVKISFKDKAVSDYRFKGTFKNETIEQALNALRLTADFHYTINNNIIEISKK